jgi:ribose 5-phosphate isomerase A
MSSAEDQKRIAALAAVDLVKAGQLVGLGTGSTAEIAIDGLIARAREGLRIVCVPTSERSAIRARAGGLTVLDGPPADRTIDITIDGADQIEQGTLNLIKGLGGALLWEKIVAASTDTLVIISDESKLVARLGGPVPVPVEVVQFGWERTAARLVELGCRAAVRRKDGAVFVTDSGNLIVDCHFDLIVEAADLERRLSGVVGVVETGLFIDMTSKAVVGSPAGVRIYHR